MADRIELTGLECFGYHGVFEEEKKTGQPFIVDVTCWLDTAGIEDDLSPRCSASRSSTPSR